MVNALSFSGTSSKFYRCFKAVLKIFPVTPWLFYDLFVYSHCAPGFAASIILQRDKQLNFFSPGALATAGNVNHLTCKPSGPVQKAKQMQSSGADRVRTNVVVIPSRVPCGVRDALLASQFVGSDRSSNLRYCLLGRAPRRCLFFWKTRRLTATARWSSATGIRLWEWSLFGGTSWSYVSVHQVNKTVMWWKRTAYKVLYQICTTLVCVLAVDFPAGNVRVTVYSGGKSPRSAQLQYYTNMEELNRLLSRVADPVQFMCQVRSL